MIYSHSACTCVPGGPDSSVCDKDVLLYFPFNDDLHDHSCNRAISAQTDYNYLVTLYQDIDRGTVARFPGKGSLDVGFINNYFAGRDIDTWTVALWFKRVGSGSGGYAGLVNNGDCDGLPSFDVHADDGPVSLGGVRSATSKSVVNSDSASVRMDTWEHVAMVYDGSQVSLYLNSKLVSSKTASGPLANTHCAMNIGADHPGAGFFTGFIDNIYVYQRALSDKEISFVMDAK